MILISSCLLGVHAKYDGTSNNQNELLLQYCHLGKYLPVCPEQLGGLPTPRESVEICAGNGADIWFGRAKVLDSNREDYTPAFMRGAEETLRLARLFSIQAAILKERSPTCGTRHIYDGTFRGIVVPGSGVTAYLLKQHGIDVYGEADLTEELIVRLLAL